MKALLDRITVGSHKLSDEDQVIRIASAWQHFFNLVENEQFDVSPSTANAINGIVAMLSSVHLRFFLPVPETSSTLTVINEQVNCS
ncbi:MAG: hypothetical protein OXG08_09495 [Gammaproteobacteria bacterium]|nr:hypothetical protein [Gammaproteobacteria bacterium]